MKKTSGAIRNGLTQYSYHSLHVNCTLSCLNNTCALLTARVRPENAWVELVEEVRVAVVAVLVVALLVVEVTEVAVDELLVAVV